MSDKPKDSPVIALTRDAMKEVHAKLKAEDMVGALELLNTTIAGMNAHTAEPRAAEMQALLYSELAMVNQRLANNEEAVTAFGTAESFARASREKSPSPNGTLQLATVLVNKAALHARLKQAEEGIACTEEALAMLNQAEEAGVAASAILRLGALQNHASLLLDQKRFEEATPALESAFETATHLLAKGASQLLPQAIDVAARLTMVLRMQKRFEEAIPVAERSARWAEAAYESSGGKAMGIYVNTQLQLMTVHHNAGNYSQAEDHLWKAIDTSNHIQPMMLGSSFYAELLRQEAAALTEGGLPRRELIEAFDELIGRMTAVRPPAAMIAGVQARYGVLVDGGIENAEQVVTELRSGERTPQVLLDLAKLIEGDITWIRSRESA
ncbi:MAG: tetratricopeptide (TPR) repeat protein [Flavobacteriales bacterium]|jgi:tetratricopeptide (TPR) repeat protein